MKLASIFSGLSSIAAVVGGTGASGRISTINTAAQTAVKAAVTEVDGGIDKLRSAYDKWESGNEVVSTAVNGTITILRNLGLKVPTEDAIVLHVKAAIADLAGILVSLDGDTTASSSTSETSAS
ncbi:MAG: hypothetical protein LKH33_10430 [Acetobacter sp.]|jgi:arginyl-tRNA synthetase|nr:hypothetical protein [Acetobacter sp.]MCH4060556.1 hypothetical protein [Acetobacter sp.]MCH4087496.1 hypothetical protein [Acetobacter sp.]MCI1294697.1 hypothetical protein [Acetobacter sp.]MCI1321154.1 hypothetical protein [Acetobacter sp.]